MRTISAARVRVGGTRGLEVGLVGSEVPLLDDIGAGSLPGVECSAVGFAVEDPGGVEPVAGAGSVEAGEGVCDRGAIVFGTDIAEEGLFPVSNPDAEHVTGFGDAGGGDGTRRSRRSSPPTPSAGWSGGCARP